MAAKTKAAPKAAAKKAAPKAEPKPVEIESITADAKQDGATLVINGVHHSLPVQAFLALRREINNVAAGLVH